MCCVSCNASKGDGVVVVVCNLCDHRNKVFSAIIHYSTVIKVSDLDHFVSVVVGYVSSVSYHDRFVKFETVSFCPLSLKVREKRAYRHLDYIVSVSSLEECRVFGTIQ